MAQGLRALILERHQEGLVPLAIATDLAVSVEFVSRVLRGQGIKLSPWLTR